MYLSIILPCLYRYFSLCYIMSEKDIYMERLMENKHDEETTYQEQIEEPIIYEYIFRLPVFLKIALILIILGLFLGPLQKSV